MFRMFKWYVSDEDIFNETGAWMMACAVGTYNRTAGSSALDFDLWFNCCRNTWVDRVSKKLNVSTERIRRTLKKYAKQNEHLTIQQVLDKEQTLRPSQ